MRTQQNYPICDIWLLEKIQQCHDVDKSKIDVIIIIRMMSELNTGSKLEDSSLHSTQAFILRRIQSKEVGMVSMNMSGAGVIFESAECQTTLNTDRLYYTPSFIDRSDIAALSQQNQQYKDAFNIKTQEECLNSSIIVKYQPKPSSNFCFVCKEYFVDYSKHIDHPIHKKLLVFSPCEDMIQDLIESEQKKRKTPTCGFMSLEEIPRKVRKLETMGTATTLALQYFKESSTCLTILQSQKGKSLKK